MSKIAFIICCGGLLLLPCFGDEAYRLTHHTIPGLIWSEGGSVNLAALLAPNAQPYMDKVYFTAQERLRDVRELGLINRLGPKFEVENHILQFTPPPPPVMWPTIWHVEFRYRDSPGVVFDRIWVVVNSPDTKKAFDAWVARNADTSWTANLPQVYPAIRMGSYNTPIDPEPGAPHLWDEPKRKTSLLHHSAGVVRSEMLTGQLPGGHGNQAWYDEKGVLIEEPPIVAGRAKKFAQNNPKDPDLKMYNEEEIFPFICAAQLDGNPVLGFFQPIPVMPTTIKGAVVFSGTKDVFQNLNRPCIRVGDNLNSYLGKRPVHPTGKLNP